MDKNDDGSFDLWVYVKISTSETERNKNALKFHKIEISFFKPKDSELLILKHAIKKDPVWDESAKHLSIYFFITHTNIIHLPLPRFSQVNFS